MCTISVVSHACGFRVVCNRDERRTRSRAHPPRAHHVGRTTAVFPVDPDGGGTWIGVNGDGLVAALLNRSTRSQDATLRRDRQSRGRIVPLVLASRTLQDALEQAAQLPSAAFEPFRLILVRHRTVWTVSGGDGQPTEVLRSPMLGPLVFASSSLGDVVVEPPRRRLFELLQGTRDRDPLAVQKRFHRHRWTDRPEISVLMSRADARTVSRTQIDVCASGGRLAQPTMRYEEIGTADRGETS